MFVFAWLFPPIQLANSVKIISGDTFPGDASPFRSKSMEQAAFVF